jgi:hypothetical protein
MNILELEQHIRDLFSEKKIEAVFIDYLELLQTSNTTAASIIRLKALAKELNIPFIVIMYLRRGNKDYGSLAISKEIASDEAFLCIDKIFFINENGLIYLKGLHNDNEEFDELIQPQMIQWSIPQ